MASVRPANLLSLGDQGRLEPGAYADIVLFELEDNNHIHIREVYKQGQKVLGR